MNQVMTANKPVHILVVDDDEEIRSLLSEFLAKHNYEVSTAKNGVELLELFERDSTIQLLVLDVMMPGIDGLELCRRIRNQSQIPIIMLTAMSDDTDKIIGLEFGADDYLAKPFNPRELLARIKSILRRIQDVPVSDSGSRSKSKSRVNQPPVFHFAGWLLDTATRRLVSPEQMDVALNGGTYDLLIAFLEHPQRVLSRDQLLDFTKNREAGPFDRSIDVQISRLRQKLEDDPKDPKLIKTVRSGGYLFAASVSKE